MESHQERSMVGEKVENDTATDPEEGQDETTPAHGDKNTTSLTDKNGNGIGTNGTVTGGTLPVTSSQTAESCQNKKRQRRSICERCQRPAVTCICSALPSPPLRLRKCHCIVLQHPQELKRKNRSLPLIELSLDKSSFHVIVSRRLQNNNEPRDPNVLQRIQHSTNPVWLVFPHPDAIPLQQAIQHHNEQFAGNSRNDNNTMITLLFLDGTWQYAKEMDQFNASRNMYPSHMMRVQLDPETDLRHPDLSVKRRFAIRTPVSDSHLSTAECIAYTINQIEQNIKIGDDINATQQLQSNNDSLDTSAIENKSTIYDMLMKPLDTMVSQWRNFQQQNEKKKKKEKVDEDVLKGTDG